MEWNHAISSPPEIVDGQWSEWSKDLKSGFFLIKYFKIFFSLNQCPIIPCQITGSIVLHSQLRTCTNPA